MISGYKMIQQLEEKRLALNRQLMDASTQAEVNRIERELWALRAAIAYQKAAKSESKPARSESANEP
jgi:hypothetical protein